MVRFTIIRICWFIMMEHLVFTLSCFIYPADGLQFWGSTDILGVEGLIVKILVSCHTAIVSHSPYRKHSTAQHSTTASRTTWGEIWVNIFAELRARQPQQDLLCTFHHPDRLWSCCHWSPAWLPARPENNQQKFSPGAQPSDWAAANHQSEHFLSTSWLMKIFPEELQFIIVQCDIVPSLWLQGVYECHCAPVRYQRAGKDH